MTEPEFPFRQFFDFRFGVDASHFFNLPTPIQPGGLCRMAGKCAFSEVNADGQVGLQPGRFVFCLFLDVIPQLVVVLLLNPL
jgi:hypothetical protein